jgi:chorismate dehydratase
MIRLGHIDYSNCVPVHSRLLERQRPPGIQLVMGVPSELNEALAVGKVDVAPCSSIEYARHHDEYVLLPDLVIGSEGAVGSILMESSVPIEELADASVWIPTASATSAVLLRILLEKRYGVIPRYSWFHQADAGDPVGVHAKAVLRIGDVALRRVAPPGRHVLDLGEAWTHWTGLPFAFAVWQARLTEDNAAELRELHASLLDSLDFFHEHDEDLARRHAPRFGITPDRLLAYWRSLRYRLDPRMQEGLLHFFALAADLGEAPAVSRLNWLDVAAPERR